MPDQNIISTQIFQAKDLPFKSVTVYEDQAELHRKLILTLKQGLNRIQLEVIFRTNTRGKGSSRLRGGISSPKGQKVLAKGAKVLAKGAKVLAKGAKSPRQRGKKSSPRRQG
jgi:hypothetical protein